MNQTLKTTLAELCQETQDPTLVKAERELHEDPVGRDYGHSQQEADKEEETARPSISI